MQLEGDLQSIDLSDLLRRISALCRTGILTVQSEHDMLAVTFLQGKVVAADAMNETMEDGLSQVLESQGLVSPSKFAELVSKQQTSGERIADLLLEQRLIGRDQLLSAIRLQTYRLLLQLLSWREGEYNLFIGDEISYEDGIEPISMEELLVRSAADLGVDSPLSGPLPDLSATYERASGDAPIKVLGRDGDEPEADPGAVWLTPCEYEVWQASDGKKPASSFIGGPDLDEYRVRFGLYTLLHESLVRPMTESLPDVVLPPSGLTPPSSLLRSDIEDRVQQSWDDVESGPVDELVVEPPEPESEPTRPEPRPRIERGALGAVAWVWLSRTMALGLLALVVALLPSRASRHTLFFPFPWQSSQQGEFERGQRAVIYTKIDTASRTYYLLFGRFPEELEILADLQLLSPIDLYDPRGYWLSYAAGDLSYTLQPLKDGVPVPGLEATGEVTGDFVLNPQFVELSRERTSRPLVLLD